MRKAPCLYPELSCNYPELSYIYPELSCIYPEVSWAEIRSNAPDVIAGPPKVSKVLRL